MKILFLDCDHVLNTRVGSLDHDKLSLLENIVRHTGCKIVISSTWRKSGSKLKQLYESLHAFGIIRAVIGETPVLETQSTLLYIGVPRKREIRLWLENNHKPERLAIVDDDPEADTGTGDYFQTQVGVGLTYPIAQRIIAHLNS